MLWDRHHYSAPVNKGDFDEIVFFQDTSETTFANPSCNVGGGAGSNNHQDSSSRNTTGSVSTGTNTYSNGQSGLANRYVTFYKNVRIHGVFYAPLYDLIFSACRGSKSLITFDYKHETFF